MWGGSRPLTSATMFAFVLPPSVKSVPGRHQRGFHNQRPDAVDGGADDDEFRVAHPLGEVVGGDVNRTKGVRPVQSGRIAIDSDHALCCPFRPRRQSHRPADQPHADNGNLLEQHMENIGECWFKRPIAITAVRLLFILLGSTFTPQRTESVGIAVAEQSCIPRPRPRCPFLLARSQFRP